MTERAERRWAALDAVAKRFMECHALRQTTDADGQYALPIDGAAKGPQRQHDDTAHRGHGA